MGKWHKFAELAKLFAPLVISTINPKLAPVAEKIADAIGEAESMPNASGMDKLAHVKTIAIDSVTTANSLAGKELIPVNGLDEAITESVNTAVDVINKVHPKVK